MERIPIQRKKGTPAWLWILLLLLVLGLVYFLFFRSTDNSDEWLDDTTTTQTTDTSDLNSPAPPPPGNDTGSGMQEVTDLKPVYSAPDKQTYVGRQVNVQSVQVQKVISDTTFWIGDSPTERMFVTGIRNGNATQKLKQGQRISIKGQVERMPDENTRKTGWGITDQADFTGQDIYLRAQEIM